MTVRRLTNQRATWLASLRARAPAGLTIWATRPPSTIWRGAFVGQLRRPAAGDAWAIDVPADAYATLWPVGPALDGVGNFVELRRADPPDWYPVPAAPPPDEWARRLRVASSTDYWNLPGLVAVYSGREPVTRGVAFGAQLNTWNSYLGGPPLTLFSGSPKLARSAGGTPVVRFALGGPDIFRSSAFPGSGFISAYSWAIAFTCPTSLPASANVGWFDVTVAGTGNTGAIYLPVLGTTAQAVFNTDSAGQRTASEAGGAAIVCNGQPHVVTCVVDAARGVRMFRDGAQVASSVYVPPNPNTLTELDVGSRATSIQPVSGDLSTLAFYNRAITDSENATLHTGLMFQ